MVQSSITAWLSKPATVKKSDEPTPAAPTLSIPTTTRVEEPEPGPEAASVGEDVEIEAIQETLSPLVVKAFSLPPLPANVELVPLSEDLIPSFKRLNALTLPIAYGPAFYTESMTEPFHGLTLIALWHTTSLNTEASIASIKPRLVGAIRCRLLPSANLYISTIGLLAPYRAHGIATHLLQRIAAKASKEHGVKCVTAHVWEANEDGLEWYKKRGFEVIGKEDAYYGKLKPSGAVLVRKWIGVADFLGDGAAAITEDA